MQRNSVADVRSTRKEGNMNRTEKSFSSQHPHTDDSHLDRVIFAAEKPLKGAAALSLSALTGT